MKKTTGPVNIIIAALLWSLAGVCAKYIPWHPLSIACIRGTVAAIVLGVARRTWRITLTRPTVLAALCMSATTILFMFSNKLTTAANAIVLQYTAPVFVILLTVLVLKTKLRPLDSLTVVLTLGGISLFFVDHLGHGALLGDGLALLSGVTFAGVFFFNSLPGANPLDSSFLGCILSVLLLPAMFFDPSIAASGPFPWAVAIFMGIFQLGFAYVFFSKGIKNTGAVASSIICTAEPILNPIWVFLVVGARPGTLSIVGAALVVAAICFYNIMSAKRQNAYRS